MGRKKKDTVAVVRDAFEVSSQRKVHLVFPNSTLGFGARMVDFDRWFDPDDAVSLGNALIEEANKIRAAL